ncbi:MAG: hypothetical protein ACOCXO_02065 [Bacteroidota bacterium]
MKEKDLIKNYRQQMDGYAENAPEGVWDNIADQLDIDEVWEHIADELETGQKTRYLPLWWKKAAMIAGVVSTIFMSYILFNLNMSGTQLAEQSENQNDEQVENIPQDIVDDTYPLEIPINDTTPNSTLNNILVEQSQQKATIPAIKSTETDKNNLPASKTDHSNHNHFAENDVNSLFANVNIPSEDFSRKNISTVFPNLHKDIALYNPAEYLHSSNDLSQTSSFAVGFSSAIKNTWLFNRETLEGLDPLHHNRAGIQIYPDFGIALQYFHNDRWSFETDMFLSSATGQVYRQYINGHYTERNILLRYFQGEMLAGYSSGVMNWAGTQPLKLKTVGGFYISRLNSATETISGLETDIAERYQNMDAGLVLGQHIDWQISKRLSVSPGLRVKWGLSDIYRGANSPNTFANKTHNRSFEFRLNFYYHFQN